MIGRFVYLNVISLTLSCCVFSLCLQEVRFTVYYLITIQTPWINNAYWLLGWYAQSYFNGRNCSLVSAFHTCLVKCTELSLTCSRRVFVATMINQCFSYPLIIPKDLDKGSMNWSNKYCDCFSPSNAFSRNGGYKGSTSAYKVPPPSTYFAVLE